MEGFTIKPIGRIYTGYEEKFGIPRQAGLAGDTTGRIVLDPPYNTTDALEGIEGYSYLWLIWRFSEIKDYKWSPTVRPPRLGGNTRMGVFATRSPFRPNTLGLSCVKLIRVEIGKNGPELIVGGADILNGTPIYDIKPYVKTDSKAGEYGISGLEREDLKTEVSEEARSKVTPEKLEEIRRILALNPKPQYQDDEKRVYGMKYSGCDIKFTIKKDRLFIIDIEITGQ